VCDAGGESADLGVHLAVAIERRCADVDGGREGLALLAHIHLVAGGALHR
jgi:hypothetical protein